MSRFAYQSQGFRVKGQIADCDFAPRPATKDNLRLWNDTRNEFHTRSNVNQQRVSHSFRRASRSFQIRNLTSLTLVPTSFALVPDSQPTVAITRGQATNVLSEHRNKEQRKRTQQRSAAMFAVYLLCVLRPRYDPFARHSRAVQHIIRQCATRKTENNKCSAVAMWMVRHKQKTNKNGTEEEKEKEIDE